MPYLAKIGLAWAFLACLATTWIGSLMGFLFAWAGIMLVMPLALALGSSTFPNPTSFLWGIWAALLVLSLALFVRARRRDTASADKSAALVISLLGLALVVHLSMGTMAANWP